ncbi:helix-turn-helix transcriptional regulator [uncultured Clostridium sp.]|uniref:helix-turn-helix transcriptional regulator n=1 Tax=uncultured Clostridium sp. TaxID=59620 RepID=UPI0025F09244|nr:helix-turn-helix transcriptional regulator [uncultured Clostridium sp.]
MNYKELGNRVREARTLYGITQSDLAEKVNCSVQHLSHIETGNTKVSLTLLVKIVNNPGFVSLLSGLRKP